MTGLSPSGRNGRRRNGRIEDPPPRGTPRHLVRAGRLRIRTLPRPGASVFENRIEALYDFRPPANHLAIVPVRSPKAAAGADVTIVDSLGPRFLSAADVVERVGVASIEHGVFLLKLANQSGSEASTTAAGTQ